jgi:hypothetical protein
MERRPVRPQRSDHRPGTCGFPSDAVLTPDLFAPTTVTMPLPANNAPPLLQPSSSPPISTPDLAMPTQTRQSLPLPTCRICGHPSAIGTHDHLCWLESSMLVPERLEALSARSGHDCMQRSWVLERMSRIQPHFKAPEGLV